MIPSETFQHNPLFQHLKGYAMKRAASPVALVLWSVVVLGQNGVLTTQYDNLRTGQNIQEPFLSPANVKPNQFRRLFVQNVDGDVYAQPLYVPNLAIPNRGTHNVVFVATQGDRVYAFDADNNHGANAQPIWEANLLDSAYGAQAGATPLPRTACCWCPDIDPQIGITGTPVIDASSGILYVVAKTLENGAAVQRLHALDMTMGTEKFGRPVEIVASVPGTGDGSTGGTLAFDPMRQNQRPGLLLQKGVVYIAWASHCDTTPFHGWIMAYDARTLVQLAVFNTTPNGADGGIWMEGAGLSADTDGSLYVTTGNGTFDTALDAQGFPAKRDFGDSILKLDAGLGRTTGKPVLDYFTPWNQADMDGGDVDLGSGGVLLVPEQPGNHPHVLLQAGKLGTLYIADRDQMTSGQHFCSTCTAATGDTNILQEFPKGVAATPVPAYWSNKVYVHGDNDVIKAFSLSNGQLSTPPLQTTQTYSGKISISANGDNNGVLWSLGTDAAPAGGPVVLNAYDAVDLSQLYSSDWNRPRDSPGRAVPWTTPLVANGRVYVGASGQLGVFSLFGVGGYDLASSVDQSFQFDYEGSGKLDHLVLYRPGTGTIWILKSRAGAFTPVYQQGNPGNGLGIGGYDLKSPEDRAFAFDYDSSGKLDHIVLYRPGAGTVSILRNTAGRFAPVYQGSGIGGYDLKSSADQAFAFDYDGSGKLDHLVLYRPGTGMISIVKNSAGTFTPIYRGGGIGGYDLQASVDRVFPIDYDGSGKSDHLVLYRPGAGIIWILENRAGTFTTVYQGSGIGAYDLRSPADLAFAYDYDGSGKQDHVALYRPGTGMISILRNSAGTFTPVYQQSPAGGIGGYDLKDPVDRAFALDYDGSGRSDHMVLYRSGTSTISIVQNAAGTFSQNYAAW
jgi:hypothetical protein